MPLLFYKGVYLIIRSQRFYASMGRSRLQIQVAFYLYCLEFLFKIIVIVFLLVLLLYMQPEHIAELEPANAAALKTAPKNNNRPSPFFTHNMIGLCLQHLFLRKDYRIFNDVELQLPPSFPWNSLNSVPTITMEEERTQLVKTRLWVKKVIQVYAAMLCFGSVYLLLVNLSSGARGKLLFRSNAYKWTIWKFILIFIKRSDFNMLNRTPFIIKPHIFPLW